MSKREHILQQQSPLPPFAENLIFWAPLVQGDLTDHVSGASLVYDNNYLSFDDLKQSYLFTKTYNSPESYFPVDLSQHITGNSYTLYCYSKRASSSSINVPGYVVIGGYKDNQSWRPCIQSFNTDPAATKESFLKRTEVYDAVNVKRLRYLDGVYVYEDNLASICYINNWSGNMLSRLAVNPYRTSSDTIGAYISDIRIYNRALTPAEVAQL